MKKSARLLASRLSASIAMMVVLASLSGCAGSAATRSSAPEPTLTPPTGPRATTAAQSVEMRRFDFASAFPKRDLERRVAFLAACDVSLNSTDSDVRRDVGLLLAAYREANDPESFARLLTEKFEVVRTEPLTPAATDGLMTGYATPLVSVKMEPDERFRFPIYADLRGFDDALATASRREILASPKARERAIAWIDDPFTWALVETNGTAILRIAGTRKDIPVSRIATNGRPFQSVGKGLAARGLLDPTTATLADVARAAELNPREAEAAALENERVVFFEICEPNDFPPVLGLPKGDLVSGFSCAADQSVYPAGSVLLVTERNAMGDARPVRIFFVHDAGGAISGPQRIDAYFGSGNAAVARAGETKVQVDVYRLKARP